MLTLKDLALQATFKTRVKGETLLSKKSCRLFVRRKTCPEAWQKSTAVRTKGSPMQIHMWMLIKGFNQLFLCRFFQNIPTKTEKDALEVPMQILHNFTTTTSAVTPEWLSLRNRSYFL